MYKKANRKSQSCFLYQKIVENPSSVSINFNPCHDKQIKMPHPLLIFSLSDNLSRLLIHIHILYDKQCRFRSVGSFRSQLIWIYTVSKDRKYPGSAEPGLKCVLGVYADSQGPDQPGHLHSLFRAIAACLKDHLIMKLIQTSTRRFVLTSCLPS